MQIYTVFSECSYKNRIVADYAFSSFTRGSWKTELTSTAMMESERSACKECLVGPQLIAIDECLRLGDDANLVPLIGFHSFCHIGYID